MDVGDDHAVRDRRGRALRDLRISVTDRCNFRCPYCMPGDVFGPGHRFLGAAERLRFDEIARVARVAARLGVRKLRLTGGEPLLRAGLPELVAKLVAIPGIDDVALTTNGALLARQAGALRAAGLGRVTVSLDSLDSAAFARMTGGRGRLGDVLDGIEAARRVGFAPIKINCVVQRGVNDDGALDLVARFRGTATVVRFIEYMDVGNANGWERGRVVPSAELVARIGARWPLLALPAASAGETAARYAFADGAGEIGFISSVTQPFCGGCTRARLAADGTLYTCLFATGGADLRRVLRGGPGDEELLAIIRGVWAARDDRYSELRPEVRRLPVLRPKVEMHAVGG